MSKRIKLTPEQIKMVEAMAAIRLPNEQIATILGISRDGFENYAKRNKQVKSALEKGKAQGSQKVYQTAFQLATGYVRTYESEWFNPGSKRWETRTAREAVPPDPKMLQFWLKTQEKWREVDRLELTGPDGSPLSVTEIPREARQAKLVKYLELFARIEHAKTLVKLPEKQEPQTIDVVNQEVGDGEKP
jgi:hypothetical protein